MGTNGNGNGRRYWWLGGCLTLAGMVFGAGGAAYVTRADVARHDKAIESLTQKATVAEVEQGKVGERLKSIDTRLGNIEEMLRSRP